MSHKGRPNIRQVSKTSQESFNPNRTFVDIEDEFLHAAEFGDVHNIIKILKEHPGLDTECSDALGRTALRLAVKNEHLEIVEILLEKSSRHHIYEAVLQAINTEHAQIAVTILRHKRYLEMWNEGKKLGATDGFYKTAFPDSQFSPDITPLILASQKNQYEIVQLLLLRGETIIKPHKFSCDCRECLNKVKFDQLRLAKYRLNAYKGLASEAYISLSSKDPILTAFQLAAELRRLSRVEKHFKREYRDLADQLSDYEVKLLDRIRTQKELELVLNKTGRPHQEKFASLARFKLALKFKEKKFVAHASCQQRVVRTWYHGVGKLEHAGWPLRLLMLFLFIWVYPGLVFLHFFFPQTKGAKILQFPVVKFTCHAISFFIFLVLIIVSTWESSQSVSKYKTLKTTQPYAFHRYSYLVSQCNDNTYQQDFPLRPSQPSVTDILLTFWIAGMVWQECNQLYQAGLKEHLSLYNIMDFLLLCAYTSTMTLKFLVMAKFQVALEELIEGTETCTFRNIYWLNTDRVHWHSMDPINVSESLFALANILSFFRISYLLPANELLGPLQISLGRMLKDIAKFGALFLLVIIAFMVGLHNLYWYFSARGEIELNYSEHPREVKAEKNFGDLLSLFRTVFWTLFGRGERSSVEVDDYSTFTQDIGYFIYGSYNVAMVTVLLNMLIAMMTRSFTRIAEDSDREWKFARSQLYMDYIATGSSLPPPLNIFTIPRSIYNFLKDSRKHTTDKDQAIEMEEPSVVNIIPTFRQEGKETSLGRIIQNELIHMPSVELRASTSSTCGQSPKMVSRLQLVNMLELSEELTYQQTVQRIVQRYIFDIQREAEVTEDDFEEIKKDITRFRYDIDNQMSLTTCAQNELKQRIMDIKSEFQKIEQMRK